MILEEAQIKVLEDIRKLVRNNKKIKKSSEYIQNLTKICKLYFNNYFNLKIKFKLNIQ